MIGNMVRVLFSDEPRSLEGELRKLEGAGVFVYRKQGLDKGLLFIPMQRVKEIVDLGRRPGW